jgi:aminoglycoside phosphotransferase (APT) family kinase protein
VEDDGWRALQGEVAEEEDTRAQYANASSCASKNAWCVAHGYARWKAAPLAIERIEKTCSLIRSPSRSAYASYVYDEPAK